MQGVDRRLKNCLLIFKWGWFPCIEEGVGGTVSRLR